MLSIRGLLVAMGLGVISSDVTAAIIVDPDAFPAGTSLMSAFPGVTLTTRDGIAPGSNARDVLSVESIHATTGTRVFAQDNGDETWGNGVFEFLRADFLGGASQVWLDFAANDESDSNAELLAFDAAGNLLDSDSAAIVLLGFPVTLSVTSGTPIAYVAAYWDETSRAENGALDNLRYDPSNVPDAGSTAFLLSSALAGLSLMRRRVAK